MTRPAVVLLSGGLDSATCLAMARRDGFAPYAMSFDYGQRHNAELAAARRVAQALGAVEHRVVKIDLAAFGGSALTDANIAVPESGVEADVIPVTYVPARNTILLSYALAWAEVLGGHDIYIGVNAVDYSGYPDCRPEYISAFQTMARLATKVGVEGASITVHTPLIRLTKAEIIQAGIALGVDYGLTVTCYQASETGEACGKCDACRLRAAGFAQAGVPDPTPYRAA
ncbi:7-cyano-7-deazaguanine synthase QueC [Chitinilyticum piscinae]|uniref:7-cyano-7-deazaguanine synthase n=1 Tax=Chitinilyticum piscinae TaxID=2866724 RepID=A0A8J7FK56_9NEIS|nr:7-cyano-7-deazaguanine synthase QueC [Chitinilyticum piscinae]MBE9608174.1 7-cyano-7-deazaguanine synthase QueC [Chitinilyticum piscinae]